MHEYGEERTRQGMAEIEAGKGIDAKQAMREIADKYGLDLGT